jgi:DNA-directed RNA polymerase specialized sigma24 family protein
MMAACSTASPEPLSVRGMEATVHAALARSLAALPLCDLNLLTFHHDRGLGPDQLARVLGTSAGAVGRQLARVHARVLRDVRRDLAPRLAADQLDRVLAIVHARLGHAIARVLAA